MITSFLRPFHSHSQFYSLDPKHLSSEVVVQRMGRLRQRMNSWMEKTDQITQDLATMNQRVVLIEKDQQKIEKEQKQLHKYQDQIDKDILEVTQNNAQVKFWEVNLNQRWRILFNFALGLKEDQKKVDGQLMNIVGTHQLIGQCANLIHQNMPLIRENHREAKLVDDNIQDQALIIENMQENIQTELDEMEKIEDDIEQNISFVQGNDKTGIDEVIAGEDHSDSLLYRMQEACLWVFAGLCRTITQGNQALIEWAVSSDFSITKPSLSSAISWIALGAFANTGMQEITFSLDELTLKTSFHEFKWIKTFAETYQNRIGD